MSTSNVSTLSKEVTRRFAEAGYVLSARPGLHDWQDWACWLLYGRGSCAANGRCRQHGRAAISCYGQPAGETDALQITAPVLTVLGMRDGISAFACQALHEALDANGILNHSELYEGVQHAFFNDTYAGFALEASADAWERTLSSFDEYLSPDV